MKKTDDRSRWEVAPINGKDVVWSFIVDGLKAEHEVIENPRFDHVAMYGSDGGMAIAKSSGSSLLIDAETDISCRELAEAIVTPINEEEGNEDLYADATEPYYEDEADECHLGTFVFASVITFYHTDIK